jgi:hypothetical protein
MDPAGPRCTCPAAWRGHGQRPACVLHEVPGHPDEELPEGAARRRDGRVCTVMATIAPGAGRPRDPEGMGGDTWRQWP